jgi:hypothetical protein
MTEVNKLFSLSRLRQALAATRKQSYPSLEPRRLVTIDAARLRERCAGISAMQTVCGHFG